MVLGSLVLAVLAAGSEVFPERLCASLPEAAPAVEAWAAETLPELARLPVRELDEEAALETIGRASALRWGSMELFANVAAREPCTLFLSQEALRSVNRAFALDLLTPIAGTDTRGKAFEMIAALAGRGRLVVFYDRAGIVYRNEREGRDFKLASRVQFDAPGPGFLENVRGLWARVSLLGWVAIRSLAKDGKNLEVQAGWFTSESVARPIEVRKNSARAGR